MKKRNCTRCIYGITMTSVITGKKSYECIRRLGGKTRKRPIWCPWFKKKKL